MLKYVVKPDKFIPFMRKAGNNYQNDTSLK